MTTSKGSQALTYVHPKMDNLCAPPAIWLACAVGQGMLVSTSDQMGSGFVHSPSTQEQDRDGVISTDTGTFRMQGDQGTLANAKLIQTPLKPKSHPPKMKDHDGDADDGEEIYDAESKRAFEDFEARHEKSSQRAQGLLDSLGKGPLQTSIEIRHQFGHAVVEVTRNRLVLRDSNTQARS